MNLDGKTLWQVGAGDTERAYPGLCLRYDVMIAGPGHEGPYLDGKYAHYGDIENSLRRMCLDAQRGDVVLLRLGTSQVHAIGIIEDDSSDWSEAFGDVDGWRLQHLRRVRWLTGSARTFPTKTFGTMGRTFAAVHKPELRQWVESIEVTPSDKQRKLAELPVDGGSLDEDELGRRLFVEGLSSDRVDHLVGRLASLRRVAQWYSNPEKKPEGRPSEHETVAFLVLPMLFALGWSEQTAAVEWKSVDIALFDRMPSADRTLACVVEAKYLDRSVFSPAGQAAAYALKPGRENCKRLIVTDGIRYAVHEREEGAFRLLAYLNLLRLRESYPVLDCGGAVQAILAMAH